LFDGTSLPLTHESRTVTFRNGEGLSTITNEFWSTPLGPVIYRANGKIYIVKTAGDGEFRAGEQFLRMMRAKSLAEWKDAMKLRARVTSNFTYADHAGNIFFHLECFITAVAACAGRDCSSDAGAHDARRLDALCAFRVSAAGAQSEGRLHSQ
jgi:acyl-homoserine-lactone acylase